MFNYDLQAEFVSNSTGKFKPKSISHFCAKTIMKIIADQVNYSIRLVQIFFRDKNQDNQRLLSSIKFHSSDKFIR